ncbi:MAG: hypothetical protein IT434_02085 [Phycisphaerales bacterium]|nr:hypothetical protein [Phycisphaerales bacterium]
MNPYTYNPSGEERSLYQVASSYSTNASSERYQARNQLQNAILRLSDQAMSNHLARLKASESFWNNSLGFATLALAAGSAATTGGVATGLAAGATVTSGTRSLINEQEFRNALVESIILLIEKDRLKKLEEVRQAQSLPIEKYDVEQAIADAIDYHQRGSFYHGLALLAEAARKSGNELEQSTASILRAKAEVAKLMGLEGGLENLIKFIGKPADAKQSDGEAAQKWLTNANPEQVASALAYLRAAYESDPNKKKIEEQQKNVDLARAELGKAIAEFEQAQSAANMAERRAGRAEDSLQSAEKQLQDARSYSEFAQAAISRIKNSLEGIKAQLEKLGATADEAERKAELAREQQDAELRLVGIQNDAERAAADVTSLSEDIPRLRTDRDDARQAADLKEQTARSAMAALSEAERKLTEAKDALSALRQPSVSDSSAAKKE